MKILVAVDGSAFTRKMLAYLVAHDEWLGPAHQYTVVHCALRLPRRAAAALDRDSVDSYYRDESAKVFKPIRTFFQRQRLQASFAAKVGHPAEVIAALAEHGGYDLLLLGSHGHGPIGRLVLGSVAAEVIARCKTPLLIVR